MKPRSSPAPATHRACALQHASRAQRVKSKTTALVVALAAATSGCSSRHDVTSADTDALASVEADRSSSKVDSGVVESSSGDTGLPSNAEPDASTGDDLALDPPIDVPEEFPPLPSPADNAPDALRTELGRRLFYDRRLSRTREVACADCHFQEHAFADPARVSSGVDGKLGTRNAPALINLAYQSSYFWDGGVPTLELQVIEPIRNPLEMDMTLAEIAVRLTEDPSLDSQFRVAFGAGPSEKTIPLALANFLRTLVSGNSAWDQYLRGERDAVTDAAVRGYAIFSGERAECTHCHTGFNFTTNAFKNNGTRPDDPDPGRQRLTNRAIDEGKFKVPTLRNVALTAPYMHDGSLATLDDVINHYDMGGAGHPNTDVLIAPLGLSASEKADLRAFLESLTDVEFTTAARYSAPHR